MISFIGFLVLFQVEILDANPHCGHRPSRSIGVKRVASWTQCFSASSCSRPGSLVLTTPIKARLPAGRSRRGSNPPARSLSYSSRYSSTVTELNSLSACLTPQPLSSKKPQGALRDYQRAGYQLGITAQFVLLASAYLIRNQPEQAIQAIDDGLLIVTQNREAFFRSRIVPTEGPGTFSRRGSGHRSAQAAPAGVANGAYATGTIHRTTRGDRPRRVFE